MTSPRDTEPRIDWHDGNDPAGSGMCAQHTWHSLGGDYGNPPAWGCSDANECVDKVRASGRYWTPATWDGPPPRGAWVGWKYGSNGHAALSLGDGLIMTTDPASGAWTGPEPLNYPIRWGFDDGAGDYTVWSDEYAGVRFPLEDDDQGADDVRHCFLYLHTSDDIGSIAKGSYVTWDSEGSDDGGFHAKENALIEAPWACVGTWMFEGSGDAVVAFLKFDADGERVGEVGLSAPGGDLVIVQDLPKGYGLRVIVKEGSCPDARLKADIRER